MTHFSNKEALVFAWQTVRQKMGYFIGLTFVFLFASVILTPIQAQFSEEPVAALIIAILSIALTLIVDLGFMKIALKTYDGEETDFPDLFRSYDLSPRYFLCTVLYAILLLLSLIPGVIVMSLFISANGDNNVSVLGGIISAIFFIVPAAYIAIRYYFFGYFLIDQESGPIESLKQSAHLTKGAFWQIFQLFLLVLGVIIIGLLALGVGLLLAYPVALLTVTYAYRKLLETPRES